VAWSVGLLYLAFVMIAGASMFGTLGGVITWLTITTGLVVLAISFGLWLSGRQHRKLSLLPEVNDEARSGSDA